MFLITALLVTQIMRFEAVDSTECGDRAESLGPHGFAAGTLRVCRVLRRAGRSTRF
jgi:hypothetical protein